MVNAVVEGESDRGAARAVILAAGHDVGRIIPVGGKTRLDPLIPKYNEASAWSPWVVFRDSDNECPVSLRSRLGPPPDEWSPTFALRIAHTMTEAWLMADQEAFARYFSVPPARVPRDPESAPHGKRALLALCEHSRSRSIRSQVSPGNGKPGPLYVHHLNEFASRHWQPNTAALSSPSLARAIRGIRQIPPLT